MEDIFSELKMKIISFFAAECSEIEKRLFLSGKIEQYRGWAPKAF